MYPLENRLNKIRDVLEQPSFPFKIAYDLNSKQMKFYVTESHYGLVPEIKVNRLNSIDDIDLSKGQVTPIGDLA